MHDSYALLTSLIKVVFPEIFPGNYRNDVMWWGNIPKNELHSLLPDGTAKMLTMDVDIVDVCSLSCPHCFRRDPRFDSIKDNPLSHEEVVSYIREAVGLGLRSIKILGRGEPFENPRFLEFLTEVTTLGIGVSIFTKGHVLGSDELAKEYNSRYGINTAWELVEYIEKLNVSILLGFNSFNKETQEQFVGVDTYPDSSLLKRYVEFRDQALINLVKAGFNRYREGEATRLALAANPVKPENVGEIFDLYTWARRRHIYMQSCPTTISGKGLDEFAREAAFSDYLFRLINLYVQIYVWSIQNGLISLEEFKEDGASLYPGCHVCNQAAAGFFLNLSGQVNQCPGRVDESTIFSHDIRKEKSLKAVWKRCANYQRAKHGKRFNYGCVARDGRSLPKDFYKTIRRKVLDSLSS